MSKYKIINEEKKVGTWITSYDLINLIKIVGNRNTKYKKRLIQIYEYLEDEKFDEDLLKSSYEV